MKVRDLSSKVKENVDPLPHNHHNNIQSLMT